MVSPTDFGTYLVSGDTDSLLQEGYEAVASSSDVQLQRSALAALGQLPDDRRVFPILLKAMENEALAGDALLALAGVKDSRGLFAAINLYKQSQDPSLHQRVLQYIHATGDPRAVEFLTSDVIGKNEALDDVARSAYHAVTTRDDHFRYRFVGRESLYADASQVTGQIMVTARNLDANARLIENEEPKPQTYVIPAVSKMMFVGGTIHEHVLVAGGEDVLAAGEIRFQRGDDGLWHVEYVNNRSNGYLPGWQSFGAVREFFEGHTDVKLEKDRFDEAFPKHGYNDGDFLALQPFGKNP